MTSATAAATPTPTPTTGWAPVLDAMTAASEAYVPRAAVVLGPAPCRTCRAWIEWLGVGPWVALGTDEVHECEPYLRSQADMAAYPQVWVTYPESDLQRASRELGEAFDAFRDELAAGLQPLLAWIAAAPRAPWLTGRLVLVALAVILFFALALARWQAGLL